MLCGIASPRSHSVGAFSPAALAEVDRGVAPPLNINVTGTACENAQHVSLLVLLMVFQGRNFSLDRVKGWLSEKRLCTDGNVSVDVLAERILEQHSQLNVSSAWRNTTCVSRGGQDPTKAVLHLTGFRHFLSSDINDVVNEETYTVYHDMVRGLERWPRLL